MAPRQASDNKWRSAMELAEQMESATFARMLLGNSTHKRVVASPGCCKTFKANKDQGPIPIREPFASGHMHGPFCSHCRCATVSSRAPEL